MAVKKIKTCQICKTPFKARRDAKTCSPACRKRLERSLKAQAIEKANRLESVLGREFHRVAAGLLKNHVIREPFVLADERGGVPVSVLDPPPAAPSLADHPDPVIPAPGTAVGPLSTASQPPADPVETLEAAPPPAPKAETSTAPKAMHLEDVMSTETLEPSAFGNAEAVEPADGSDKPANKPSRSERFMPFHFNKLAFMATGLTLLALTVLGGGSLFLTARHNAQAGKTYTQKPGDFAVTNVPLGSVKANPQLLVSDANQVAVNGQLQVNDTLVITPTSTPTSPVIGQVYFDQTAKAPFYYDGSKFISLAPQEHVTSIGGSSGVIGLGNGLSVVNNQLSVSSAITQQINNAAASGVLSLSGTANQINVSSSTGNITLSLPQDIAVTSTPTFGGLTLGNALTVANGGTGNGSFTANGILYGNGTGALQVTASAANSVLVTNGAGTPSLSQTLPLQVQDNITHTGVLVSGSINNGFGAISTLNNITTTALVQAGSLEVDGGSFTVDNTGNFVAAGTGAVQGAGGLTLGIAGSVAGKLNLANATSTREVVLQGLNPSGAGNATVQIPTIAGGSTDTVCLVALGNCAGSGGGIIGSGTAGAIALFNGTNSITDSATLTESGSTLTASGNAVIQGSNALTLGTANTNYGAISFKNQANSNTLTLQSGNTAGNLTLTLPTADGTGGQCLQTNGSGALGFADCTGGSAGGVHSVNGLQGTLIIDNATGVGSHITIADAKADASTKGIATFNATNFTDNGFGTINTIQDIATTSSPQFKSVSLNYDSTGSALSVVQSSSNPGLLQALILANNNSITPSGNLLDLQNKGTSELHVDVSGNLTTIGNIQGVNIDGTTGINTGAAGGTQRIDATGNLVNIGNITTSGTITLGALGTTDTSAILCRNSSNIIAACNGSGSGAPFVQGGNSFGTTAVLGTNDNFGLDVRTNGATALSISNTGKIGIGVAPTSNIVEMQGGSGVTVGISTTTNNAGDSAYLQVNNRARFGYSNGNVIIDDNSATKGLQINLNGGTALQFAATTSAATFKNASDSATAFQIQNQLGTSNLFVANTLNTRIGLGVAPIITSGSGLLQVGATNSTTADQGISFGGSTTANLYRSAPGTLTTDGNLVVAGATALTLGKASNNTGKIVFQGSGGTGTLTLAGPTTPNAGNFTLTIPAITGNANVCTDNSVCTGYAPVSPSGNGYIQNTTTVQTSANFAIQSAAIGSVTGVIKALGSQTAHLLDFQNTSGTPVSFFDVNGNLTVGTSSNVLTISSPGAGASSEHFGASSSTSTFTGGLAVGNSATTTGNSGTALGASSTAAASSVAVGNSASAGNSSSIALGAGATTTASNQLVVGANGNAIQNAYIGNGVTNASPASFTLQGTGGSGNNIAGASITLAGGVGTGLGVGGNINFQVASFGVNNSFITGTNSETAVAVDGTFIYWANDGTSSIGRANLDGTGVNQNFITGVTDPWGIAVDSGHIYWTSQSGNTIGRANIDGTGGTNSFITGANTPWGIAVDSGHIYWTNYGNQTIGRANIDGTSPSQSFISGLGINLHHLTVDSAHIYWVSSSGVGRANINGTGSNNTFISFGTGPYGIVVDSSYIYWANDGSNSVGRANLDGTGANQSLLTGLSQPRGLAINSSYLYWNNFSASTIGRTSNTSNSANTLSTVASLSGNNGAALFKNATDSTAAFQVQNAAGNNFIQVDTSNANLYLGNSGIASTVQIGNTTGAVAQTINIGNNASLSSVTNVTIGSTIGTSSVTIQSGTGTSIDVGSNAVAHTITIGNTTGATAVNIKCGTGQCQLGSTGTHTTTVGSATSSSTTNIQAGTGGLSLGNDGVAHTVTVNSTTGGASTVIQAGTSGIQLFAAGGTSNPGVIVHPSADTTLAFQIQNALGTSNLLVADTTNTRIGLGVIPITTSGSGLLQVGAASSTTAVQGISFGGDTVANLYRSAASTLKTDGTFNAATALQTNGTSRIDSSGNLVNIGNLTTTGTSTFTATGANGFTFKPGTNNASTLLVQDQGGTAALTVSTNNVTTGANAAASTLVVAKDSGTSRSINAAGTVNASGTDYAEYIPWIGPEPDPGSIVEYKGSAYVVSSQLTASFVGGDVFNGGDSIMVAFAGQVPTKVTGPVNVGDILVDNGDGTARAVSPAAASIAEYLGKVGIAQEDNSDPGVKLVHAAVGTTSANVAGNLQQSNSFTNLNVSGTANINDLTVTGSATIASLHVTSSAVFDTDITVGGHIITAGGQPTSQPQVAAGGSASVSVDGTDTTGTITITTGNAPTAGDLAKIFFSKTYGKAPHIVLSPSNSTASGLHFYKGATTATDFIFDVQDTPQANTVYTFDYFIAQ